MGGDTTRVRCNGLGRGLCAATRGAHPHFGGGTWHGTQRLGRLGAGQILKPTGGRPKPRTQALELGRRRAVGPCRARRSTRRGAQEHRGRTPCRRSHGFHQNQRRRHGRAPGGRLGRRRVLRRLRPGGTAGVVDRPCDGPDAVGAQARRSVGDVLRQGRRPSDHGRGRIPGGPDPRTPRQAGNAARHQNGTSTRTVQRPRLHGGGARGEGPGVLRTAADGWGDEISWRRRGVGRRPSRSDSA